MWDKVIEFIKAHQSFLLTTHIHPEGDAIGSEMALKAFLKSRGKHTCVVNSSETPRNCEFLDPKSEIMVYPDTFRPDVVDQSDGFIILDVNGWIHLGRFAEVIQNSTKPRVCIDHHQGFENDFVDILVSDTSASATGVLVYELIKEMGGDITPQIAEAIYASIVADTGTFRFTNTDARTFQIAAELYENGADPFRIHRNIFANRSWGAARLMGPVLNTIESAADGKVVWIRVTKEMFEQAGAVYEDSDGILELVRAIKGVELCLFFKQTEKGPIKVSVRSNGLVDAYRIARLHGGGGHRMASGLNVDGPMEQAIEKVVQTCLEAPELKDR
ncbi:MAG: hypothetical protein GTO51_03145 [Candidatus Latescibacteria bacterium]|nr:hypothetical protein [Candidatus Latescibacterota bacterium]NIM22681.1 hypothetical protein [Candidatus Latescibacterota bacterium]NIM64970.1 hypothetical protein [Candidatus Latescibacterota bacterium]NIO01485.1 hypothetical protein [Candidatus Latescibacterota bacterium]NIO27995.1 hypothetical protein [Candidatus Latescibacterota bacterium]